MSELRSPYTEWLDAYELAVAHASDFGAQPCPNCGSMSLRLVFIVDDFSAESGTAVFWCDHCLRGLIPMRGPVPISGERVLRGTEHVPDYVLVIDE